MSVSGNTESRRAARADAPTAAPGQLDDPWAARSDYRLGEFLRWHDREFLLHAYQGILKREPDPEGLRNYLGGLRSGRYSRSWILGRLRYSPEGRGHGVRVRGIVLPFVLQSLFRIPLFGPVLEWPVRVLRLPRLAQAVRTAQQYSLGRVAQVEERLRIAERRLLEAAESRERLARLMERDAQYLAKMRSELERDIADAAQHLRVDWQRSTRELERSTGERLDALRGALERSADEGLKSLRNQFEQAAVGLGSRLERAEEALGPAQKLRDALDNIARFKRDLALLEARLGKLLDAEGTDASDAQMDESAARALREEAAHELDGMYASFEDRFRGSTERIAERQAVYVPYIQRAGVGTAEAPVLDLGCGRGEWLELLRNHGLVGRGVDLNRVFLARCRDLELDVSEADALAHLRALGDGTLGAVTGFHIIEHLPYATLLSLFDESLRVLRPGGLLIVETPNPDNLLVGSRNFYVDPTHLRPLPSPLIAFLLNYRGFTDVEVLPLQPAAEYDPADAGSRELDARIRQALDGPQDYGVIAYRP